MSKLQMPAALRAGEIIGIASPAYLMDENYLAGARSGLEALGFKVKAAPNVLSSAWGYAGTVEERAEDMNLLLRDPEVRMVLFGGGEVCNQVLPYLDYEALRRDPKLIMGFSDATTLVEALSCKSGVVTFYGQSPSTFVELTDYNRKTFQNIILGLGGYEQSEAWRAIAPGDAEGVLTGGYLINFAAMLSGKYYQYDPDEKYILFLEDHEMFSQPCMVDKWLYHIEQSGLAERATGVIFGQYADGERPQLAEVLERLSKRWQVPVYWTLDFGHGRNNAIFPVGVRAKIENGYLSLLEKPTR